MKTCAKCAEPVSEDDDELCEDHLVEWAVEFVTTYDPSQHEPPTLVLFMPEAN